MYRQRRCIIREDPEEGHMYDLYIIREAPLVDHVYYDCIVDTTS